MAGLFNRSRPSLLSTALVPASTLSSLPASPSPSSTQSQVPGFIAKSVEKSRSFFSVPARLRPKHGPWSNAGSLIEESRPSLGSNCCTDFSFGSRTICDTDDTSAISHFSELDEDPFSASTSKLPSTPVTVEFPRLSASPSGDHPSPSAWRRFSNLRDRPTSAMTRRESTARNSFLLMSDTDKMPAEATRTVRRQLSRAMLRGSTLSRVSNAAATKARAALHCVKSSFKFSRPATDTALLASHAPRLTLYRGPSEGDLSSLNHMLEVLMADRTANVDSRDSIAPSPAFTLPEWVEPHDAEPHHLNHTYRRDATSKSPYWMTRRLSSASGHSLCPDRASTIYHGAIDFRTATDMALAYADGLYDLDGEDLPPVPMLEHDPVGSSPESDSDTTPLSTPRQNRPPTPHGLDVLIGQNSPTPAPTKLWSDRSSASSTTSLIDPHLDLPRFPLIVTPEHEGFSAKPLPPLPLELDVSVVRHKANDSLESLFYCPTPPGPTTFVERFRTVSSATVNARSHHLALSSRRLGA